MTPLPYLLTLFIVLNIRFEIVPFRDKWAICVGQEQREIIQDVPDRFRTVGNYAIQYQLHHHHFLNNFPWHSVQLSSVLCCSVLQKPLELGWLSNKCRYMYVLKWCLHLLSPNNHNWAQSSNQMLLSSGWLGASTGLCSIVEQSGQNFEGCTQ